MAGVGFACLAARQSSVMVPMINPTLFESRNRTLSGLPVVGNWWQPRGDCGKPGPLRPRSRRADRRARLPEERRRIVKVPSRVLAPRLDVGSGALKAAGNSTALPFGKIELQRTPKPREITPRPRAVQNHGAHSVLQASDNPHHNYCNASYGKCDGKHVRKRRVTENTTKCDGKHVRARRQRSPRRRSCCRCSDSASRRRSSSGRRR